MSTVRAWRSLATKRAMRRWALALILVSSCRAVRDEPASAEAPEFVADAPARSRAPAPEAEVAPVRASDEIAWESPEAGFARAAREGRPVVVVLTATWCGHCRTYAANVLSDPRVIEASSDFVMVRIDVDQRPDLARRFALDGGYVPRTLFLTPEGQPRTELHAPRARYLYFLATTDPAELLGLMARARS